MGGVHWQGLIYSEADLVMRRMVQVPRGEQPRTWQQLQILEDEARAVLNAQR